MSDYEKVAELYSRINEQMILKSKEQEALNNAYDKLMKTLKIKIGSVLDVWEKDIEKGKITDENTIQGIRGMREQYNTMFKENK